VVAFATPIIRLLFERGAFTAADTSATSAIMRVYALGLLGQAAVGVLTRSYFSRRTSIWYPALVMGVGLAVTALVGAVLMPSWGGVAIAAGNAIGITLTAGLMLAGLRSGSERASSAATGTALARLLVAAGCAGIAGWLVGHLLAEGPLFVVLMLGGFVVVGTFVLVDAAVRAAARPGFTGGPGAEPERRLAAPFVLMYHSVGSRDDDPHQITVSPVRFAEQMAWLRRRGLCGTSMRELLDAADRGRAAGLVGLTFDDGYADFSTEVLPVLARHGFTATVFVVAGRLGGHNDWEQQGPVKPLLSVDQIRVVARAGIEIGSHGLCHRHLPEAGVDALRAEAEQSRVILESVLGAPVHGFCYPYGGVSDAAVDAARSAGYDYAVAIRSSARADRHALPRTYVGERDGAVRLAVKHLRHRLMWRVR
jgi:peptidoglycan/xylan/chitin deacetylase (PgdA/CDA1 family)